VLTKLKTPMIMENRALITAWYTWYDDDGAIYTMGTDKGNDACYEQYCDEVGKDVIMRQRLSYNKFYELDGTLYFEDVQCYSLGGKVPDFIQKWASNQAHQETQQFAEFLANGVVPSLGPLAAE